MNQLKLQPPILNYTFIGGADTIKKYAGKDATEVFNMVHKF